MLISGKLYFQNTSDFDLEKFFNETELDNDTDSSRREYRLPDISRYKYLDNEDDDDEDDDDDYYDEGDNVFEEFYDDYNSDDSNVNDLMADYYHENTADEEQEDENRPSKSQQVNRHVENDHYQRKMSKESDKSPQLKSKHSNVRPDEIQMEDVELDNVANTNRLVRKRRKREAEQSRSRDGQRVKRAPAIEQWQESLPGFKKNEPESKEPKDWMVMSHVF